MTGPFLVRLSIVATVLTIAGTVGVSSRPADPGALPGPLERFLATSVRPTAAERKELLAGAPITKLLDSDESSEVAVFGAVWIAAPPARYLDAVRDIEHLERGAAFRATKRIGNPPAPGDFARMTLPDDDVDDLRDCSVGDCKIKLSAEAIETLRREVDWSRPTAREEARALFRRIAFKYVTGYVEGGNARLAVYRDKSRPRSVADEFRSLVDQMPAIANGAPALKRYLLDYPGFSLPGSTDVLYWQETAFGLKPTIRISHVVIDGRGDMPVVASKMIYASHYFWTALETRMLVPDPSRGTGFWFVTVNRSRSDGLSGFLGIFVRGRVRKDVRKGTLSVLTATKWRLEGAARQTSPQELFFAREATRVRRLDLLMANSAAGRRISLLAPRSGDYNPRP